MKFLLQGKLFCNPIEVSLFFLDFYCGRLFFAGSENIVKLG